MAKKIKWKKPHLHVHGEGTHEHKATWLELFYDLVFVAIVAELAHLLAKDINLSNTLAFIALFFPTWWAWLGSTYYNNRFDSEDLSHRLMTFVSMIIATCMAYYIGHAFHGTFVGFTLSYIAYRLLIIFMWARAGYHNPVARPMTNRFNIGSSISVLVLIGSIFVESPLRYILWTTALAIDYFAPLLTINIQKNLPRISLTHMPERFGLFMILVLGESIVGFVQGLSETGGLSSTSLINGGLGLILAFTIWWLYFDHINSRYIKESLWWITGWIYAHLPLVIAVTALGAGILNVVPLSETAVPSNISMLLCMSVSIALLTIGMIELTLQKKDQTCCKTAMGRFLRFSGAALIAGLSFVPWPNPWSLLSCLILIMIFQVYIGFENKEHLEEEIGEEHH